MIPPLIHELKLPGEKMIDAQHERKGYRKVAKYTAGFIAENPEF
jgi:hypothetical protein